MRIGASYRPGNLKDDKRVRRISLTDEAGPVIDQLNRGIREINEIVLSDISEEEIRQMEETMEMLMPVL